MLTAIFITVVIEIISQLLFLSLPKPFLPKMRFHVNYNLISLQWCQMNVMSQITDDPIV